MTCDHCGTTLTVGDYTDLRVCTRCYQDVMDRTHRRGRYAPEPTVAEIQTWPGVWNVTRTLAGWLLYARPEAPEDAVGSARKLADTTGRTVTVQGLVVHP